MATRRQQKSAIPVNSFDQVCDLLARAGLFDISKISAELKGRREAFAEGCLHGEHCFSEQLSGSFAGLSVLSGQFSLYHRQSKGNSMLSEWLSWYFIYEYLHYRLLRVKFKQERRTNLYGIFLNKFGFVACGLIWADRKAEATWLCREYIRHVDANFDCPYSLDHEFQSYSRWLVGWYLGDDPLQGIDKRPKFGDYLPLTRTFKERESAEKLVDEMLAARTKHAYQRYLLEEEVGDWIYSQWFEAVFPLEVLAFIKLYEKYSGRTLRLTHPILDTLVEITPKVSLWDDKFVRDSLRRIGELERNAGIV